MSPMLVSLFINDIELALQTNTLDGITLDQKTIYLLLFADDAVLISDSKEGLQLVITTRVLLVKNGNLQSMLINLT